MVSFMLSFGAIMWHFKSLQDGAVAVSRNFSLNLMIARCTCTKRFGVGRTVAE